MAPPETCCLASQTSFLCVYMQNTPAFHCSYNSGVSETALPRSDKKPVAGSTLNHKVQDCSYYIWTETLQQGSIPLLLNSVHLWAFRTAANLFSNFSCSTLRLLPSIPRGPFLGWLELSTCVNTKFCNKLNIWEHKESNLLAGQLSFSRISILKHNS